jgi:hypothetical protein
MKKIISLFFMVCFLAMSVSGCSYQPKETYEEPVIYTLVDSHGIPRHFKETENGDFEYVDTDGCPISELFGDNFDLREKWTKEDVDNWYKELEEMRKKLKEIR